MPPKTKSFGKSSPPRDSLMFACGGGGMACRPNMYMMNPVAGPLEEEGLSNLRAGNDDKATEVKKNIIYLFQPCALTTGRFVLCCSLFNRSHTLFKISGDYIHKVTHVQRMFLTAVFHV
jgi:hypothetical protein